MDLHIYFFNVFFYQEVHVKEKYQIFVILQDS